MLCKNTNDDIIEINNNSNNAHNDDDESIDYWHEMLQSTKEENVPHLKEFMQTLYIGKLQSMGYEQHNYAIIKNNK